MKKNSIFMNLQYALYFSEDLEEPQQSLWRELNSKMDKELDQTPIILPIPKDPKLADIPIVQAVSKNSVFRLNISRKRVDFFIYGEGPKAIYQNIQEKFYQMEEIIIRELRKIVQIKWIGLISNYFVEEKNPDKVISQLIKSEFRKLHQGKTLESSIDYISQLKVLNKIVNNHTQLQAGRAKFKSNKNETHGVLISRDFNTKPKENGEGYVDEKFSKEFVHFVEQNLNLNEIISLLWKV